MQLKKFLAFLERVRWAQPSPTATAGQGGEKNNEADVRLFSREKKFSRFLRITNYPYLE